MINITGSIKRAFIFPADIERTLAYYSELTRVATLLPHITLVQTYAPHQIRVLYESVELGAYNIQIYSDLESKVDFEEYALWVYPVKLKESAAIEAKATSRTTTGQGLFAIDAQFFDLENQTRIEYHIRLQASLERPLGMRLMPRRVVNRIAQGITDNRIREIADGFIKQSIADFAAWQTSSELIGK